MTRLIETLISGLSLGSIYALMALGYTMVYGIAKMLNFAHGDIIMVGAYAVVTSVLTLGMPPLVAILIASPSAPCWASPLNFWPTGPCGRPRRWRS